MTGGVRNKEEREKMENYKGKKVKNLRIYKPQKLKIVDLGNFVAIED
jgi:hypothetical protein